LASIRKSKSKLGEKKTQKNTINLQSTTTKSIKYKSSNTKILLCKINRDKLALVTSYNMQPGNRASLFLKEKIKEK